ncbi:tail tape measure protein [Paenibacillus sp. SN-8-1]|uniref:tail tape measure protein n=1 Tax=Paenibacillus sp. SN-8-1 TaxID=3435409 RepID=UPI003D9A461A
MASATTRITVPFEAKDLISGAIRNIRSSLQSATDDLIDFRRASGQMNDDFVSSSRRARSAADDFGNSVNDAADEVRRLGREQVDDVFHHARSGADELRRSAGRADAEIRGLSDARVHIRARDEVSPALEGISSRITALASMASGIIIGGSIKDAMFGDIGDYYAESSRSAALLPADVRAQGLTSVDNLYKQGFFTSRAEGAKQLADVAPLSKDKSKVGELLTESAKIQHIRPDSGVEEIYRALTQASDTFKETYGQTADSMMYAYQEVGDRQQDLFDTFWEYSGYFKNTGASSAQMSNFLVKSVQDGSFNFDKPADFFKEMFGVKALSTSDMANYFVLRGAGKDEAERQANAFTGDINSGDAQRAKGALMALVGDLASQSPNQLKQSLVTMGSATAEDNGNSVLKNFATTFEQPPSNVAGTTDRLVTAQQKANPLLEATKTRREIDLQVQEIGTNITSAALPALKQFNELLTQNKDGIQALGKGIADFVGGATKIYKDHFMLINSLLGVVLGGLIIKKGINTVTGVVNTVKDIKRAGNWVKDRIPFGGNKQGTALGNGPRLSAMTVQASNVYITGSIGGNGYDGGYDTGDDKKGKRKRGGSRKGKGRGSSGTRSTGGYRQTKGGGGRPQASTPATESKTTKRGLVSGLKDSIKESGLISTTKGIAKAAGVIGGVVSAGYGIYNLYEASKESGWKEAISNQGGSVIGGAAGGTIGGILGSIGGPLGSMLGATAGNWIGSKLGGLADASGFTGKVVDTMSSIGESVSNLTSNALNTLGSWTDTAVGWFTSKKEEKPAPPVISTESKVTFANATPEKQEKLKKTFNDFSKDIAQNGMKQALTNAMDKSGVTETVKVLKDQFVGMFKSTDSKQAQSNIKAVGTEALKAAVQAKQLGETTKSSTQEVVQGARQAGQSFAGVSSSVKNAVDQARQHLFSLSSISSQGSSWGSNLMSMMASGIRSKYPALTSAVTQAAGVIKNFLGFHSPTKEGPASDSDRWAGNFVSMFAGGLKSDPIKQRMDLIAGTMRSGTSGVPMPESGAISMASTLSSPVTKAPGSVTIGNVSLNFGELAKQVTNFTEFAKMMTSPEGRALIRKVLGEEIYKTLENGG